MDAIADVLSGRDDSSTCPHASGPRSALTDAELRHDVTAFRPRALESVTVRR